MASLFVEVDKPFYFAGDTVQGNVYMNLFQNLNASEVTIKFKGWESARWIEERIVREEERNRIQHNMIWNKVT